MWANTTKFLTFPFHQYIFSESLTEKHILFYFFIQTHFQYLFFQAFELKEIEKTCKEVQVRPKQSTAAPPTPL